MMTTTKIVWVLMTFLLIVSCTKHKEIIDNNLKIGNVVCSDGSILNPLNYAGSEKKAIAVVFWCNNVDSALAIALNDLGNYMLMDTLSRIESVSGDTHLLNGAQNTAAIMNFAKQSGRSIPAVESCIKFSPEGVTGWYLPSAGETKLLNSNLAIVNQSLDQIGTICQGWYWTSTEDATGENTGEFFGIVTSIHEGRLISSEKTNSFNVRPVISIR